MKICYFCCSSAYGGLEKIVVDTLNQISKFYECGLIIPVNCQYKEKVSSKIKIYEYSAYNKRLNPLLYIEIFKAIRHYDIVHTHGAKASQIAYFLNKFSPFTHIATKHNIRKGNIFNKIQNVMSVSNEVAKTITHTSKVLYFGIPLEPIEKEKTTVFTITAVGRLDPIKGFDRLIEEVSKLRFDFKLNIIGEGKHKAILEKLISSKNLEKKISLLGFQNNIPSHLAKSDLHVISSYSEGLPLTLIEGILYAPIIISTPVGGIVEILDQDFLTNIDNFSKRIHTIYSNYEKEVENFKKKHTFVKEKFNLENYIHDLITYYKGCIDAKSL